jgi:hypothetical protein
LYKRYLLLIALVVCVIAIGHRYIYASTARGNGWQANGAGKNWTCGALSSDGVKLAAVEYNGYIYTSTVSADTAGYSSNCRLFTATTSGMGSKHAVSCHHSRDIFAVNCCCQ